MGTVIEHKLQKGEWTSSIHVHIHNIICLDYPNDQYLDIIHFQIILFSEKWLQN